MSEPIQNLNPYTITVEQLDELAKRHPSAKVLEDFPEFNMFFQMQRTTLAILISSAQAAHMWGPPAKKNEP